MLNKSKNSANRLFLLCVFLISASSKQAFAEETLTKTQVDNDIHQIMSKFCFECHNSRKQEGNIRLNNFASLEFDIQYDLLGKVQEQVFIGHMPPPDDADEIPTDAERQTFLERIQQWHQLQNRTSTFDLKLSKADYGNYVDHDKLFSGEFKDHKGFTYDRKWLISEYIFNEKINTILKGSDLKNNKGKLSGSIVGNGIVNPFTLPKDKSGILYYANKELNGDVLETMLGNAKIIAETMINKNLVPASKTITQLHDQHHRTLDARKVFLTNHIDDICQEVYKGENEAFLPAYKKIPIGEISEDAGHFGKWGFRNSFGSQGKDLVFAINKFQHSSKSTEEIIEKCARFWAHSGLDSNVIEVRVSLLRGKINALIKHSAKSPIKYKPLDSSEMEIIAKTIKQLRTKGMTYKKLIDLCMSHWSKEFAQMRKASNDTSEELVISLIQQLYAQIYNRPPTSSEMKEQSELFISYVDKMGTRPAVIKLTQTLLLSTEFIYRLEYGQGQADQYGRKMLSPQDASIAIAYALTDKAPDKILIEAAEQGRLNTREDYRREVLRILADRSQSTIVDNLTNSVTDLPIRKMRFFRDFFGYPKAMTIFKDNARFGAGHTELQFRLIYETDMLVDYVLQNDKNVFEELLTSDKFYVFHDGNNDAVQKATEYLKPPYEYFTKSNWKEFKNYDDLMKHKKFLETSIFSDVDLNLPNENSKTNDRAKKTAFRNFTVTMGDIDDRFSPNKKNIAPFIVRYRVNRAGEGPSKNATGSLSKWDVTKYYGINPSDWDYPPQQPATIEHRKGMLTHPAWLMAHAHNTATDPVIRGRWVREKLLAGKVPDVPITVDAQIPEDPHKTLRQRLDLKTKAEACWKCHHLMNPLGLPFELYDDFGRYRAKGEELEYPENALNADDVFNLRPLGRNNFRIFYKTAPVDATGELIGTGDAKLDGKVTDAFDMIDRLGKSTRVRQSIIRHAFRYFMGRNETLSDSKTLMDADEAYLKSDGSFDAVIVSLLTSDSFIYRKQANQ